MALFARGGFWSFVCFLYMVSVAFRQSAYFIRIEKENI